MALFFDADWFDGRLSRLGLSRAALATALGLSDSQLGEVWKDQRELSARDVGVIAQLLDADPAEIASHAGVSTPMPRRDEPAAREDALADIARRLARIEEHLAELTRYLRGRG